MTTSDSEDFESADEEIESDLSISKSKNAKQHGVHDNTSDNPLCSSDLTGAVSVVSEITLHGNDKSKLEKESSVKSNDALPTTGKEVNDSEALNSEQTSDDSVGKKDSVAYSRETSVENAVLKSDSPEVVHDEGNKPCKGPKGRRPQRIRENKSGPMKLGVRVGSGSNKTEVNENLRKNTEEILPLEEFNVPANIDEEKKEPESYSSLLDKMGGLTTNSEDVSKKDASKTELESPSWGFGKSLLGGGGGWGSVGLGWGSSLLNTATMSVSTLGNHVTQGISTVLETVEAGIGAPSPEELARKLKEEDKTRQLNENKDFSAEGKGDPAAEVGELEDDCWGDWNEDGKGDSALGGSSGLLGLVSGVTQVTGKVLSTGLDTLEVIGKKTMEVLQEGDPGLKKKRALLLGGNDDTVILSQVLREAKEKAEAEALLAEEKEAMRKAHFETLFDDYQGLVHLEALEMLSHQSDLRLKTIVLKESGPSLRGLQIRLAAVQEMCELPDSDEDNEEEQSPSISDVVPEALKQLGVEIMTDKLIQSGKDSFGCLEKLSVEKKEEEKNRASPRLIHQEAITALAILTANSIEVFHKATELLLVKEKRHVKEEAEAMVKITSALTSQVNKIASEFSDFLSTTLNDDTLSTADKEKIESFITSIFLEASNSSTYIQDAFQLMVPVLQLGAVE